MTEQTVPRGTGLGIAAELAFSLLLIAFGCLCIDTTVLEVINFMVVEYLDSALYSQLVGAMLVCSGLHQGVMAVRRRAEPRFVPLSMLLGLVMTAIYILGFAYVGFYVSTFVFLFGYSLLIEPPDERNVVSKALFAFISVAVLYGLFSVFKIYLPTTWLF